MQNEESGEEEVRWELEQKTQNYRNARVRADSRSEGYKIKKTGIFFKLNIIYNFYLDIHFRESQRSYRNPSVLGYWNNSTF